MMSTVVAAPITWRPQRSSGEGWCGYSKTKVFRPGARFRSGSPPHARRGSAGAAYGRCRGTCGSHCPRRRASIACFGSATGTCAATRRFSSVVRTRTRIERTSFAEAPETKGFVVLELARSGLRSFEFRPLPARTMVTRTVPFGDADDMTVHRRLAAVVESTPGDAVVQLRVTGRIPSTLTAATLRAVAGARTVTLAIRTADRRTRSFAGNTPVQ
jgi:hypothetical protein